MECPYKLIVFDLDGTLAISGNYLSDKEIKMLDEFNSKQINENKKLFNYKTYKNVKETLEILRKFTKLALISNGHYPRQKNKLILAGIYDYFDLIYISQEIAIKKFGDKFTPEQLAQIEKPSIYMFKQMNKETKTLPEECIYIGNIDNDQIVAAEIGWDFIRIKDEDPRAIRKLTWEKTVHQDNFKEILKYLLK